MNQTPLKFVRSSTPTTFHLSDPTGHGWGAYCTVNNTTGELAIMSDWGAWSYLWSPDPKHLGAPTLMHFIAERGGAHYLAQKLLGRRAGRLFDAEATTRHFQHELAVLRLEHGRRGTEKLTKARARDLWDDLNGLIEAGDGEQGATLYVERFCNNDDLTRIFNEPWEDLQYEESNESQVLIGRILPALMAACAGVVGTSDLQVHTT